MSNYEAGRRNMLRTSAAATIVATALILSVPGSALAACQPGGATVPNGATVNCTGTDVVGVGNGTQSNTNVTVQSGASITLGNAASAIFLKDGNTITNSGAITVGATAIGVNLVGNNNTVTSSGTITLGASSVGIFLLGNGNSALNSGTISSSADGAVGIDVLGAGNTATSSGSIVLTGFGYGMSASGASTIINNGSIQSLASGGSYGMWVDGGATAINNGTIKTGASGTGVFMGDGNSFTNNGTVNGGQTAITLFGSNNTIVNNGTLRGNDAGGSSFGSLGTVGDKITNNGTLDGSIMLLFGANNLLVNNGLITTTNPLTAIGFLNYVFSGTFTQSASGTLALRATNAGAIDSFYADSMKLNGKLAAVLQPGLYADTTTYKMALSSTAPISGTFASTAAFAPGGATPLAFFTVTPTYNATTIDVTVNRLGFGAVSGETQNERAVGNALNAAYSTGLTGNAATFFGNLLQATSVKVLDPLTGEGTAGTQNAAFLAGSTFMDLLRDQSLSGAARTAATPLGYAAEPQAGPFAAYMKAPPPSYVPSWRAWGAGFGGSQSVNGDPVVGSSDFSDRFAGGGMGLDYQLNNFLIGVGVGGSRSNFSVNSLATTGTVDGGHVGLYGVQRFGTAYVSGQVSYGRYDNSTSRVIGSVGPTELATGNFASNQIGGRLELGNRFAFGNVGLTPFAAVEAMQLREHGYTETSVTAAGAPGMLGLTFSPVTVRSLPTFLGAQIDTRIVFGNGMVWQPYARASWEHEFNPTRQVTALITPLPTLPFTVSGAQPASDSARVDLGSQLAISRNVAVSANVNAQLSNRSQTYAGTGTVRVSW